MNNNKIDHPSGNLADDVYNNIDYHNVQQKKTIYNSLYTLANNKLQLSSDLEDPNTADDWKSTNSYKGELVIAYNTKAGNNTLHPSITANVNEINDKNNNKGVHPSDNLTPDNYSNIKDHEIQQEWTNHNSFYTIVNNQLQSSAYLKDLNKTNNW